MDNCYSRKNSQDKELGVANLKPICHYPGTFQDLNNIFIFTRVSVFSFQFGEEEISLASRDGEPSATGWTKMQRFLHLTRFPFKNRLGRIWKSHCFASMTLIRMTASGHFSLQRSYQPKRIQKLSSQLSLKRWTALGGK